MAVEQKIRILTSAERAEEARKFVLPDTGNLMVAMIFGWGLFCFLLVTTGGRFLRIIAGLTNNPFIKEALFAGDETILTALMLSGTIGIIVLVLLFTRIRWWTIGLVVFSFCFGSASWKPLHDFALLVKYPALIFLCCFGGMFVLKNFWRMLVRPYLRILLLYLAWTGFVLLTIGGRPDDLWWLATDFALIVGLTIAYLHHINDSNDVLQYSRVLAWAALAVAFFNALSVVVGQDYLVSGRFVAMYGRATGFGVNFAPLVLCLFWMGMYERRDLLRQVFVGAAIVSLVMILWSGTRSATLAIVICVTILWWIFRTRIFIYMFLAASLGLVAQVIGTSDTSDFQMLSDRFLTESNVEEGGGRFEVWGTYMDIIATSPIYGHSFSGLKRQVFGNAAILDLIESLGRRLKVKAPHSIYVGTTARFGVIGLVCISLVLFFPIRRGIQVIRSKFIPKEEKQIYSLQFVLVVGIAIMGVFEDLLSGTGKGTVVGVVFFPAAIICEVHGLRLINTYAVARIAEAGAELAGVRPASESGQTG